MPAPVRVAVPVTAAHHEPARDPDDGRRVRRARSACPTTRSASTSRPPPIALGAQLLEKHFTLDRTRSGPDHPFAIEPDELKELVAHVRDVEAALGDGVKRGPSDEERVEMYAKARRSVVAACAIPAGTRITRDMLTIKRPGHGIAPKLIDALVGRTAAVDIDDDDVLTWEML